MALPSDFPQSNVTLKPAPGTEDEVVPLRVHYCEAQGLLISCWAPTPEELAEINRTGKIWLYVFGTTSYPVAVSGLDPFKSHPTDVKP